MFITTFVVTSTKLQQCGCTYRAVQMCWLCAASLRCSRCSEVREDALCCFVYTHSIPRSYHGATWETRLQLSFSPLPRYVTELLVRVNKFFSIVVLISERAVTHTTGWLCIGPSRPKEASHQVLSQGNSETERGPERSCRINTKGEN